MVCVGTDVANTGRRPDEGDDLKLESGKQKITSFHSPSLSPPWNTCEVGKSFAGGEGTVAGHLPSYA